MTLENARAASKTSTRAIGRGRRGGGCRGHGCYGGRRVICSEKLNFWIIEFQLISHCSESLSSWVMNLVATYLEYFYLLYINKFEFIIPYFSFGLQYLI